MRLFYNNITFDAKKSWIVFKVKEVKINLDCDTLGDICKIPKFGRAHVDFHELKKCLFKEIDEGDT